MKRLYVDEAAIDTKNLPAKIYQSKNQKKETKVDRNGHMIKNPYKDQAKMRK